MKRQLTQDLPLLEALGELSPGSSRTTLRSWVKQGRVQIDGQVALRTDLPTYRGQTLSVSPKGQFLPHNLRLLYEDKHILVIDKPSGLLSVATDYERKKTAHAILKFHYHPRIVHVVHRLDQDTSGVMLFALSEEARQRLKEAFEKHALERHYIAIVEGRLAEIKGKWESYLYEDEAYRVHSTSDSLVGEYALTHFEVLNANRKYSRLHVQLETGKKNQIRVHCRDAGHPVVGDKKYGAKSNPLKRLCLHSERIVLEHPITHKPMRFESPPPPEFAQLIE